MKPLPPKRYDNAHLAWLCCLYTLTRKIRCEGLMSIEGDVEMPTSEYSVFQRYPQTLEEPYLSFATDILRLMVGGNLDADDVGIYARHYQEGLLEGGVFTTRPDATLLRAIWLILWASIKGYTPQVAVEFGRQAIPVKYKPSFSELETLIKATHDYVPATDPRDDAQGIESALDRFFATLGRR